MYSAKNFEYSFNYVHMYSEDTWYLQNILTITNFQTCAYEMFIRVLAYPNYVSIRDCVIPVQIRITLKT